MLDHYKMCKHSEEDKSAAVLCRWLMEHTSTEFMEANINEALSCLQGQRISGYIGNTGVASWSGSASFYNPRLEAEDVRVDLQYFMDNSKENREDFLQFTVHAE